MGAVAEAVLFGPWGLLETSALAQYGEEDRLTRLETRWTMDFPAQQLRLRLGDATAIGGTNTPFRFTGIQLGRHFALSPSMITYPTPALAGEAAGASVVELYVDGALQARERVDAGPFVFDHAPLVSGAGDAQVVVTDLLGRSEVISRPFFVSTSLLRSGLSDWSLAAGAEREDYGRADAAYGKTFITGRYRRGLTNALTAEGGVEILEERTTLQLGAVYADHRLGQLRASHAASDEDGSTEASWLYSERAWSAGVSWAERDPAFHTLGASEDAATGSTAINFSLDFGAAGSASLTAAEVRFADDTPASTLALSYSPDLEQGALSLRLYYTDHEERDLTFGVSFSLALRGDVTAQLGAEVERGGATVRASAHRAADQANGLGWRVRGAAGEHARADAAVTYLGPAGQTSAEVASTSHGNGARVSHSGSVGWVERHSFAARRIDGAFALVDVGEANVGVMRDRLPVGVSNRNGRVLAVNLRPYDANTISIAGDDLPLDRAPATTDAVVTPAEAAGVVVRFPQATMRLTESRIAWRERGPELRGQILVRNRDGERFPIGTQGRIALIDVAAGDVLHLESVPSCTARADLQAANRGLVLECALS